MSLILVGYWRGDAHPEWPDPYPFVDPSWDEGERHKTSLYFSSGTIARTYMGRSSCRFCGGSIGSNEFTDGTYLWPEGLTHYIDEHQLRLPQRLVDHAIRRLDGLDGESVDGEWWRSLAAP
jgi:hypothetical protein